VEKDRLGDLSGKWIKVGKGAIGWTRLSCRSFAANAVRLQSAISCAPWRRRSRSKTGSLTSLQEKLIK